MFNTLKNVLVTTTLFAVGFGVYVILSEPEPFSETLRDPPFAESDVPEQDRAHDALHDSGSLGSDIALAPPELSISPGEPIDPSEVVTAPRHQHALGNEASDNHATVTLPPLVSPNEVVEQVHDLADPTFDAAHQMREEAGQIAENWANQARELPETIGTEFENRAREAEAAVEDVVAHNAGNLRSQVNDMQSTWAEHAKELADQARRLPQIEAVGDSIRQAVDSVAESAEQSTATIQRQFQQAASAWEQHTRGSQDTGSSPTDPLVNSARNALDSIGQAGETLQQRAETLPNRLNDQLQRSASAVAQQAEEITAGVRGPLDSIGQRLNDAAADPKRRIAEAATSVHDALASQLDVRTPATSALDGPTPSYNAIPPTDQGEANGRHGLTASESVAGSSSRIQPGGEAAEALAQQAVGQPDAQTYQEISPKFPDREGTYDPFEGAWATVQQQIGNRELANALFTLSLWYQDTSLSAAQRTQCVELLDELAGKVIYSTEHHLQPAYVVRSGDTIDGIAQQFQVPPLFLARVNGITPPYHLQEGEELKVVQGPFRAEIDTRRAELTLFAGSYYAGRFPLEVGTRAPAAGEFEVTSKVVDPSFLDPSSGAEVTPGSAENPYGRYWIGLRNETTPADIRVGLHGRPDGAVDRQRISIALRPRDIDDVQAILSVGSSVMIR